MATAPERAQDYHADPTLDLRSTIAKTLVMKTPAHAKAILDGQLRYDSDAMTLGTAVHQMLLRDDRISVVNYDNWKTNAAKEARAKIRGAGLVPILRHQYDEAREIAQHVNWQILEAGVTPTPFTKGTAEHVIRFEQSGVSCRALLDWLRDDFSVIDDLKTTSDASPAKFARHVFNMGYDIQAAFYRRAVIEAYEAEPVFRFIVVETKPPYPVTIHTLSDRALESANVKVDLAVQLWKECTETGVWPGYPQSVQTVDIPGWADDMAPGWDDTDLDSVPF